MTDNARVAEERKWEVVKERREGDRGGVVDWWQRVKRRIQWCPCPRATRSIRPFVRSLARQQHHHKTSLSSGNFSGIVTVNNVHLTFSFSLPHIVSPTLPFSLSIIKLIVDGPVHVVAPLCPWMHLNRHPFCYPDAR